MNRGSYPVLLANDLEFNVKEIVKNKVEKNKSKYPVEKAFGVNTKYANL
ncbi:hypothetical protein COC45_00095 [Bacillus cereus]|nr:hypothetical protein COC45_00095 [Bacillus cereus]